MIGKILKAMRHPGAVRMAVANAVRMAEGEDIAQAVGGLTEKEIAALIGWLPDEGTFVEFGTLFGFTAKAVAAAKPGLKIVAVDNFSWNPFGLPPKLHEQFTRRILASEMAEGRIEVVNSTSEEFRRNCRSVPTAVFLDAQHEYEVVKSEIAWARAVGVRLIMGHDYANPSRRFGVTEAVDEAFGNLVEVVGMCWRADCG